MVPNWLTLAHSLEISLQDITHIKSDHQLEPYMKAKSTLDKWLRYNSYNATYKKLIEVLLEQGDAELATNICSIVKGEGTGATIMYIIVICIPLP